VRGAWCVAPCASTLRIATHHPRALISRTRVDYRGRTALVSAPPNVEPTLKFLNIDSELTVVLIVVSAWMFWLFSVFWITAPDSAGMAPGCTTLPGPFWIS